MQMQIQKYKCKKQRRRQKEASCHLNAPKTFASPFFANNCICTMFIFDFALFLEEYCRCIISAMLGHYKCNVPRLRGIMSAMKLGAL